MERNILSKSGGAQGQYFQPHEVFEIGKPGTPTEIIVHNGKIYIYNEDGDTLIEGGYIKTRALEANSITADKLNVVSINVSGEINADYIRAGDLTIGGIAGHVGKISFLDTLAVEYGYIDNTGLVFENSKGIYLKNTDGGNAALFFNNVSNNTTIRMGSGGYLSILNNNDETILLFEGITGIIHSARTGYSVGTTDAGGGKITTFRGAFIIPNSSFCIDEYENGVYNYGTINFGQTFTKDPVLFVTPLGVQNPSTYYKLTSITGLPMFKNSVENIKIAQGFQIATQKYIDLVTAIIVKEGEPTGDVYCDICSDNAGNPGTVLGTSEVLNISTMPEDCAERHFLFDTPIQISASTTYWIVFRTENYTYSAGVSQIYTLSNNSNGYANGQAKEWDGSNWNNLGANANNDIHFNVYERYQDAFDDTNSSVDPIGAYSAFPNVGDVLFSGQIEDLVFSSATLVMKPDNRFYPSLRYLFTCLFYGVP